MFRNILTNHKIRLYRSLVLVIVSGVVVSGCSWAQNLAREKTMQEEANSSATVQLETNSGTEGSMNGEIDTTVSGNGSISVSTSQSQTHNGEAGVGTQETRIKITADENSFSVQNITVTQGTQLTLELLSSGGVHSFVIDELGVDSGRIPLAQPRLLQIPTKQPGSYEFYSASGSDRENGMTGTLTVTE